MNPAFRCSVFRWLLYPTNKLFWTALSRFITSSCSVLANLSCLNLREWAFLYPSRLLFKWHCRDSAITFPRRGGRGHLLMTSRLANLSTVNVIFPLRFPSHVVASKVWRWPEVWRIRWPEVWRIRWRCATSIGITQGWTLSLEKIVFIFNLFQVIQKNLVLSCALFWRTKHKLWGTWSPK